MEFDDSEGLRILLVTGYYKPGYGGVERVIDKLTDRLINYPEVKAIGILTTHFTSIRKYTPNLLDYEKESNGVEIFRIYSFPKKYSIPYFTFPLNYFREKDIAHVIEVFKPNVINWHGDGWFYANLKTAALVPDAKVFYTPHFHPKSIEQYPWTKSIDRKLYQRADKIINVSEYEAKIVGRLFNIPSGKQKVIPWGVDLPDSKHIEDDVITILCVGRIGKHKNQKFLIDVWLKARKTFRKKTKLVFIGKDEKTQSNARFLKMYAEMKGANQTDLLFTGELSDSDLKEWYSKADIFALFSDYEAFGLAYLEALSYGIPILTHNTGPNATILEKGSVIVNKNDKKAAIQVLAGLVNNEVYRNTLSKEAKDFSKEFSWDRIAEKYVGLFLNNR